MRTFLYHQCCSCTIRSLTFWQSPPWAGRVWTGCISWGRRSRRACWRTCPGRRGWGRGGRSAAPLPPPPPPPPPPGYTGLSQPARGRATEGSWISNWELLQVAVLWIRNDFLLDPDRIFRWFRIRNRIRILFRILHEFFLAFLPYILPMYTSLCKVPYRLHIRTKYKLLLGIFCKGIYIF